MKSRGTWLIATAAVLGACAGAAIYSFALRASNPEVHADWALVFLGAVSAGVLLMQVHLVRKDQSRRLRLARANTLRDFGRQWE